ncbi:MAG: DegT/DnrJ/EryC1/StrS aminotransferase family protein [Spirochaetaceae bacterium]|nr:MAG: DegT/DnrJ/EryC1/StrS aminotransferase family protein [Spirochaetaceae bacterium]
MIPAFRPTIRRADMDAVLTRLAEDSIGSGGLAAEFSQKLARYVQRRSGVSMRSYGHAFTTAFSALGLEPGARVGYSVLSHDVVRRLLLQAGFEPVPIDTQKVLPVLPSPLDVDYQALDLAALYVDARLGYVADLDNLGNLGIPLVEDVSEGLGGNTGTTMAGAAGDITLIGLEPEHIITAGGGAVVATSHSRRVPLLNSAVDGTLGNPPLPDMNAALGLTQIKQLERFVERRQELAARFLRTVQKTRHVLPVQAGEGENVFFALPLLVDSSPRDVEQYARTHGVTVTRAFSGSALIVGSDEIPAESFPNALSLASRMVLFPLYPTLGKTEQERVERVLSTIP